MSRPRRKVGDGDLFELAQQRQVEKQRAAVATRHEIMKAEGKERGSRWTHNRGRLAEIMSLIRDRHHGPVDTADGGQYLEVAIPHLIEKCGLGLSGEPGRVDAYIHRWARVVTPLVPVVEVDGLLSEARIRNRRHRLHWLAQIAGDKLAISRAERKRLGIVTMRPAGMDDAEFEEYQRAEATLREQVRRIRKGATPRADSKAVRMRSLAQELGVSVSTVKRKLIAKELTLPPARSAREPVSCRLDPMGLKLQTTDQGQALGPAVPGPARNGRATHTHGAGGLSPMARTMGVAAGRTVALPLPGGEWSKQGDLFRLPSSLPEPSSGRVFVRATILAPALAALDTWHEGAIPAEALALISTITHARGLRSRTAVAKAIGIERPTWANAVWGRYGLGPEKVERVKAWISTNLSEAA